jgi:ClpP class serine protease
LSKTDDKFPRTTDLPSQSPLFWVEQKDRYLRQLLIRDIESLTKRRLVVYFANRFANAQIDAGDCAMMAELLGDIGTEPFDLLLETNGGGTDATEGLISLIKNMTTDFRVVVANAAKSNGTLLGLAAQSIVLGATSELGPIEPLVQGIPCTILEEQKIADQNFPLHMYGKFALQQTRTLARTLLADGMMKGKPSTEIDAVVAKISSREAYFSHGSVIDHREANTLGLNVEYLKPEDEIWKRLWLLLCMYEHDCRRDRLLKVFEGRARSLSLSIAAPAA